MSVGYIDFISAYCDRWCERCAYTSRCSTFAITAATAMCGDFLQGMELAIGVPQPVEPESPAVAGRWIDDSENEEMSGQDLVDSLEREQDTGARVAESSITKISMAAAILGHGWLMSGPARSLDATDGVLREAIEVARYDASFIPAKLARALEGRERARYEDDDQPPGQEDWNGSAKVALISLERSCAAWLTIAQSSLDETPREMAAQLRDLRLAVEREFPGAWRFVRPGFDEPSR
jgi:hypothetical protein